MILNENVARKVIPIAGGKGGVGKSILAVNLALSMAISGKKTILIDLDLGGSNIHTLLGIRNNNPGIGNYLSSRKCNISDLICETEWENLNFIPGDVLVYGMGELQKSAKSRIISDIMNIEADYILVDLGGGNNFTVIDFFLISNSGLIVTTPQTTSIMNAYSFLKNYVFRFLQRAFATNKKVSSYIKRILKERRPGNRMNVIEMVSAISKIDNAAGEKLESYLEVLQPRLILNKVNKLDEVAMGEGLRDLCEQNLAIKLECLGTIMTNPIVDLSVNIQRPFILDHPNEIIGQEIHRVSQKIIQSVSYPEMPLELDYYSDSFELAHIELENDLTGQQNNPAGSSLTNQHDIDRLLELIRMQQSKIRELQGTVSILSINQ